MKQLKFLTNISFDGKPVWFKDHSYEVMSEGKNGQGNFMYKLICEDLKVRGIDTALEDRMFKVIEIKDKEEVKGDIIIEEEKNPIEELKIEEKIENVKPITSNKNHNKKGKKSSKN